MNTPNFIKEVKAAVSGGWPKKQTPRRKVYKTAEEICREELNKPEPKGI